MKLTDNEVAGYLQQHPEFFENFASMLSEMYIPHPHGGRAISINERQVLALREKNKLFQNKLSELLGYAEENDALALKVHQLSLDLVMSRDLNAIFNTIYLTLREEFDIPHVLLKVWADPALKSIGRSEQVEPSDALRSYVDSLVAPYCGPLSFSDEVASEIAGWIGREYTQLKSCAVARLHNDQTFGVLILGSEDAERFYPEMATLYLQRLVELINAALSSYVKNVPLNS